MQILKYILKRIIQTIPLLFIVSIISFFIIRLSPVDPLAELRLNPSISQATLNAEIKRMGLDKPVIVQYFYWAKAFICGDLGVSVTGEKVSSKLMERIPNTLFLMIIVVVSTWIIAVPLGVWASLNHKKSIDRILTILTSIGMAIPSFFFALLLLIFAVKTGWFPVGGLTSYNFSSMNIFEKVFDLLHHVFLPALVLITVSLSGLQ